MPERHRVWAACLALLIANSVSGQSRPGPLDGMWSDPSADPVDDYCSGVCTQAGIDRLNALLDDPANDARPYRELVAEANAAQNDYVLPLFTPLAFEHRISPLEDPGFTECRPWGLARQMLARHQLEIRTHPDRVEMHYGEWDARRTVWLDAPASSGDLPPSLLGYSVGRYEGDTLVIETEGVSAGLHRNGWPHTDQLRAVERYSRDGDRLLLTVLFEDPVYIDGALELKKIWGWAPDLAIAPYDDCEIPEQ